MNEEIEEIFKDFTVNDVEIPVTFLRYRGNRKKYITYQEIANDNALNGDDMPLYSESTIDFDVYAYGNYLDIISELKKIMLENNYIWNCDSEDMYEEDTGLYHKTVTFVKERKV